MNTFISFLLKYDCYTLEFWIPNLAKYVLQRCTSAREDPGKDAEENKSGTQFSGGDWALAVRWLDRTNDDCERRTFESWVDKSEHSFERYVITDSTELRALEFTMLSEEPLPKLVEVRKSSRTSVKANTEASLARCKPQSRPDRWIMPITVENDILSELW